MATTNQVRDWWYLYRCSYGTATTMFGRSPVYAQNTDWVRALEAGHLGAGYVPTSGGFIGSKRNCPSGISGQPCQPNGEGCSLHNYGLAWDVEYNYNPHLKRRLSEADLRQLHGEGKTKYTPEIVAAILSIKNTHGETLFAWLGYSIGDLMHWQINVPPERRDVDWTTVPGAVPQPPTTEDEMLTKGDDGWAVTWHQDGLNLWANDNGKTTIVSDGAFGASTEAKVKEFQTALGIPATGTIGAITSGLLMAYYGGVFIADSSSDGYSKSEADARFVKKGTTVTTKGTL